MLNWQDVFLVSDRNTGPLQEIFQGNWPEKPWHRVHIDFVGKPHGWLTVMA